LLRQLKPDRTSGLSLTHRGSSNGIAVGRNVIDLEGDNIATPKLAVDRDIEQRQVARLLLYLKPGPNCPDVFLPQGRLGSDQLAFIPRIRFSAGATKL
jgi:hypothetical protein